MLMLFTFFRENLSEEVRVETLRDQGLHVHLHNWCKCFVIRNLWTEIWEWKPSHLKVLLELTCFLVRLTSDLPKWGTVWFFKTKYVKNIKNAQYRESILLFIDGLLPDVDRGLVFALLVRRQLLGGHGGLVVQNRHALALGLGGGKISCKQDTLQDEEWKHDTLLWTKKNEKWKWQI